MFLPMPIYTLALTFEIAIYASFDVLFSLIPSSLQGPMGCGV